MRQVFSRVSSGAWVRSGKIAAAVLLAGLLALGGMSPMDEAVQAQIQQRPPAPGLDGGIAWLNTEQPLSLPDLRGRIILLDFWALC